MLNSWRSFEPQNFAYRNAGCRIKKNQSTNLKLIDMKKLLIISVLCGFVINSYSQLNYFLPDSNAYFSVSSFKFWFQGDTIIDSKKYKAVFQQHGDVIADFNKATYYAAVREDTIGEKIYCIRKFDEIERLICDFSLNADDTASIYTFWPAGTPIKKLITVKTVDSIEISGQYRKRINVANEYESSDSWIEGIGSTFGLFYPSADDGNVDLGLPRLLCVHVNSDIIYQISDNCYEEIYVGINENTQYSFKVYPNPAKNILNIEREENSGNQFQYYIINSQGYLVDKGVLPPDYIDISILEKGVYFIGLYNKNTPIVYSNKFVKI